MTSEKVKEIKKALEQNNAYIPFINEHYNWDEISYADILTLINELESENDTLHTNLCEWRKENQQLKDRIENQRMTKKGFRYEILPSTEYSPRRVKDYNEYCTLYNRLAELEDKIEDGTLAELPCKGKIEDEKEQKNIWGVKNGDTGLVHTTCERLIFVDHEIGKALELSPDKLSGFDWIDINGIKFKREK